MMIARIHVIVVLICVVCVFSGQKAIAGEEQLSYDRINLSASASTNVENDTLIAVLYYQKEGSDLSEISNEVNKVIGSAIEQSKKTTNVIVQTLGYHSSPVYQKERLAGWRVRQSIRLESKDITRLSKLTGNLQSKLAIDYIGYEVSPESRSKVEEQLISEAIAAFNKRAKLITKDLGRTKYRLVEMNVNTTGAPIRPMHVRSTPMMAEAAVAPPAIEAGQQKIQVNVQGKIELQVE